MLFQEEKHLKKKKKKHIWQDVFVAVVKSLAKGFISEMAFFVFYDLDTIFCFTSQRRVESDST